MKVLHVLLHLFFIWNCINGQSEGKCLYLYTSLPPGEIGCNPYVRGIVGLECSVMGSNIDRIQWYFSPPSDMNLLNTVLISNSSKYDIRVSYSETMHTAVLFINGLLQESDMGLYWCQALHVDGTIQISPSSMFELQTEDTYAVLPMCPDDQVIRSVSSQCASVNIHTTENATISTTSPWPTSISSSIINIESSTNRTESQTETPHTITGSQAKSSFITLYIVIGVVIVLLVICILLIFIIFLLCRKARIKDHDQVKGFSQRAKENAMPSKGIGFSGFPSDTFVLDDINRNSSGDYAEIGPALMTNVCLQSVDGNKYSHYSEINAVQPAHPPDARNQPVEDNSNNYCYDIPILSSSLHQTEVSVTENDCTAEAFAHNYSRLKRIIPLVQVNAETIGSENIANSSISPAHFYHIPTGQEYFHESENGDTSEFTIISEHPYHILEQSTTVPFDGETSEEGNYYENELVDQQLYNVLDQSINSSSAGICDVDDSSSNQHKLTEHSATKSELPIKMLHDDYGTNHVTHKVLDAHEGEDYSGSMEELVTVSKYLGDYERDPIYMERLHETNGSNSGNNSSPQDHYQPLEVNSMDPIQNYEKCKKLSSTTYE